MEEGSILYPFSLQLRLLAWPIIGITANRPKRQPCSMSRAVRVGRTTSIWRAAIASRWADSCWSGAPTRGRCWSCSTIRSRKESPDFVDAYLATAELALDKYDNALAAETLRQRRNRAKDPQYYFLLARAYGSDEPEHAEAALAAALAINPRHVDSLLLQVDHLIDAEQYAKADECSTDVFAVNVIIRGLGLQGGARAPGERRQGGSGSAVTGCSRLGRQSRGRPLIGRKLSEKYRFAEGAEYQRRAWRWTPTIGRPRFSSRRTCCGWARRKKAGGWPTKWRGEDGYNVVRINLVTLQKDSGQVSHAR